MSDEPTTWFRPVGELRVVTENTVWHLRAEPTLAYLRMPKVEAPRIGETERLDDLIWHAAERMAFERWPGAQRMRVWPVAAAADTGRRSNGLTSSWIESIDGEWVNV